MTTTEYPSTSPNDPRSGTTGAHQPPADGYRSPAGAYRTQSDDYRPQAGAYGPPAGDCQPPAGGFAPPAGPYQPPMPPVTNRRRRSTAALIVGAIIVVSGLLTAISGGALLALFGSGNVLGSGSHVVSTPTTALVADMGMITDTNAVRFIAGTPTLHLEADSFGGAQVFVGIGRADDVARYLAGADVDQVSQFDLNPFRLDTVHRQGAAVVGPPRAQTFWVASAQSATGADLDWAIQNGHYQLVIMNADGSANVQTSAAVGVSIPESTGLWILVIGIGAALVIVGGVLMALGAGRSAGTN